MERPVDKAHVTETIAKLGGIEALRRRAGDFYKAVVRLEQERADLMAEYPGRWVAVGKDGLLAVADSMEEVFAEVESAGWIGSEFEVEFLDSDPPDLIL